LPEKPLGVHLDLDGAWERGILGLPCVNLREWGPRLRYFARKDDLDEFVRQIEPGLGRFVLYGSGDFHHLSALLIRRLSAPVTVISFDNHPDWDVRPPRWSCGGWINRALEFGNVKRAAVWGCGNFELGFPSIVFANHRALRTGRLEVHAWAERQASRTRRRFNCMTRENWRARFTRFVQELNGGEVYVTIDLDCLRAEEVHSNWENGLFSAGELARALLEIRHSARIVGADVCGAYSRPAYARWSQRVIAYFDHPPLPGAWASAQACRASLEAIWKALTSDMIDGRSSAR